MDILQQLSDQFNPGDGPGNLVKIAGILLLAWLVSWVLGRLLPPVVEKRRSTRWSEARRATLANLVTDVAQATVYIVAFVFILSLYFPGSSILTALGLFSAGLGLAARPFVSDVISGVTLLFDDHYTVGEKVQLFDVIGRVEEVQLRNTLIRADSGELYIVPNGEVRLVRNFSRSSFSLASVQVSVPREQVAACLPLLREVAAQVYAERDDVVEEPMVLSESGLLSSETLLTVKVKAEYGHGREVRTNLITRIHHALSTQGIIATPEATPEHIHEQVKGSRQTHDLL